MKVFCAVVFAVVLALAAAKPHHHKAHKTHVSTPVNYVPAKTVGAPMDDCKLCVSFTGQAINQLLNIIINGGVIGSCGKLCGALGNKALEAVCTIFCDIEGIQEFIKLIEKADLDPIYFCELLKTCPTNDNSDATITGIIAQPASGPQGTTFNLGATFSSVNGTSTGEVAISVKTLDNLPLGGTDFFPAQPAGTGNFGFQIQTQPDPSCQNPPCEEWLPGVYEFTIEMCYGECGSKHPHSRVYSVQSGNFTIA